MNSLTKKISEIKLDENEDSFVYKYCEIKDFDLMGNFVFDKIVDIIIPFYAIWSMFPTLPLKENINGKNIYRYLIVDERYENTYFVFNSNEDSKFIKVKKWEIFSNVSDDKVNEFLTHINNALNCYYKYYEKRMITKEFKDEDPLINESLKKIRKSILEMHNEIKNY